LTLYYIKYGFIIICLLITIYYKRPFPALFTAIADYYLVIRLLNEIGVTIFIFAHLCYAVRFTGKKCILLFCLPFTLPSFAAALVWGQYFGFHLVFAATFYAQCFLLSLTCALVSFFRKRFPHPSGILIITGMMLFVLCDICVLIFQTAHYTAANIAFNLIWLFYAPSQLLLALSTRKFTLKNIV